jgi:hypothetical protein
VLSELRITQLAVIENLTARNYTENGFYWDGVHGYRGSYLTAYRNGKLPTWRSRQRIVVGHISILEGERGPSGFALMLDAQTYLAGLTQISALGIGRCQSVSGSSTRSQPLSARRT